MECFYLKLRNNIYIDSDLQLAEKEVSNLFRKYSPITKSTLSSVSFIDQIHVVSNSRKGDTIGYLVSEPNVPIQRCAILLSFIQEIWCDRVKSDILSNGTFCIVGNSVCIIPMMSMSEFLFYTTSPDEATANKIVKYLATLEDCGKSITAAVHRANTSTPHLHSFHTYKAKFFPRFVHSLIVSNYDVRKEHINVCDSFVGSGTTLIESALMGHESIGIDIDALSCFISKVKSAALNINLSDISNTEICSDLNLLKTNIHYTFPDVIERKFIRWNSLDEMRKYQEEISSILNNIEQESSPYKELHKIALSDALTRKFNVRMMGTGSGRFALEIGKKSIDTIVKSDIANEFKGIQTIQTIKNLYGITATPPSIIHGSATKRDIADKTQDIIITSPPYLPASSGREDYLIGKLISLKAMGLYNDEMIRSYNINSIGSMSNESDNLKGLPNAVIKLYNWLLNDELRSIKAKPIIAYYNSLKEALVEDKRILKDCGRIIYIIGKESVFYKSSTKEILYTVNCEQIFKELAESIGLKVIETINIELDKKNRIARPRGTDKYYECAIIMEKSQ